LQQFVSDNRFARTELYLLQLFELLSTAPAVASSHAVPEAGLVEKAFQIDP
jgi:hypothetical protein